ncbi:pyridoxamine 5'-phosphate oxidase family protein [Streptomyces geranii]|uniref:pyridoxamine 5'-phosphate oxidase family protein n=1 Tax=Streptomyces geranii TaxID=2058923 RepID=UPI0013009AE8|nr:pyridoxamine 5'-phosphate oxidase family protein [Streptomyces geranii]
MSMNDFTQRAAKMIRENRFLTLATHKADEVWAAPINYVVGTDGNLYFYSAAEARHSRHVGDIAVVAGAVFNSMATSEEVDGLQFSATCEPLDGGKLEAISEYYFRVNFPDEVDREWWYRPASAFTPGGTWRFYQLSMTDVFVIDFESVETSRIDKRVQVDIDELRAALRSPQVQNEA